MRRCIAIAAFILLACCACSGEKDKVDKKPEEAPKVIQKTVLQRVKESENILNQANYKNGDIFDGPLSSRLDFEKIYTHYWLIDESMKKGKFEKTDDYNKRIKLVLNENGLRMVVPLYSAVRRYDADSELLFIYIYCKDYKKYGYGDKIGSDFLVNDTTTNLGTTEGSNAFGVKVKIKIQAIDRYFTTHIGKNKFPDQIKIKMPPDEAKNLMEALGAYLEFEIKPFIEKGEAPRYTASEKTEKNATISDPISSITSENRIFINPIRLYVVDVKNKKICATVQAK